MTRPEDALARARDEAERKRAAGGYPDSGARRALDSTFVPDEVPVATLGEWAVIEVDPRTLYSTKPLGAPVTAVKRLLARLMRQYLVELEARQTRFNVALLGRFAELERRVQALERRVPPGRDGA